MHIYTVKIVLSGEYTYSVKPAASSYIPYHSSQECHSIWFVSLLSIQLGMCRGIVPLQKCSKNFVGTKSTYLLSASYVAI